MALDKAALATEVTRLSPEFARPTTLDVLAALSLQGSGGGGGGGTISSGDVSAGIDASTDIGTIITALNAIKGSTDLIDVAAGINNSADINAIIASLNTLATNSITPASGRLPVAIADLPGTEITGESIATGGSGLFGWLSSIAAYSRQILARIPELVSGRIPVDVEASVNTALTDILSRLSSISAFSSTFVERTDTNEQLTMLGTYTNNGTFTPFNYFLRANGTIDTGPGTIRPFAPGRTLPPATSWTASASDSEWHRRFYRLMFPGGITRSTVTTAAIGAYTLTAIPAGQRIVITRVILQLLSGSPAVTVLLRSVGASPTTEGSYRLVIEGDAVLDPLHPATYIRLTTGHNIGLDLSVASGVYCQFYWYAEDPATGLPITA
jgi:hypothetical protein